MRGQQELTGRSTEEEPAVRPGSSLSYSGDWQDSSPWLQQSLTRGDLLGVTV